MGTSEANAAENLAGTVGDDMIEDGWNAQCHWMEMVDESCQKGSRH